MQRAVHEHVDNVYASEERRRKSDSDWPADSSDSSEEIDTAMPRPRPRSLMPAVMSFGGWVGFVRNYRAPEAEAEDNLPPNPDLSNPIARDIDARELGEGHDHLWAETVDLDQLPVLSANTQVLCRHALREAGSHIISKDRGDDGQGLVRIEVGLDENSLKKEGVTAFVTEIVKNMTAPPSPLETNMLFAATVRQQTTSMRLRLSSGATTHIAKKIATQYGIPAIKTVREAMVSKYTGRSSAKAWRTKSPASWRMRPGRSSLAPLTWP